MKLYLYPDFVGEDKGDGGIRRVVEAQKRWLPEHGIEFVDSPALADICATHILATRDVLESGKPLAVHNHGLYWAGYQWLGWALKANAQCMEAIRQADAITAPSEWVAQAIRRNSLRRPVIIGHGVELDEWGPGTDEGYVLWNKTRVDAICDPTPLNVLAKMAPDVQFLSTFGNDNLPNVTVTGNLSYADARARIANASVYLCTAKETFGIGTLEAMACGVPVLGWRCGGQVEIVRHKSTGWLATPGDYEGLLEGLRYCLDERVRLGRNARALIKKKYQWRDVMRQYAELYKAMLTEKGPRVSVIIPAYNLAEFLPETLDSVLAQTFKDWECVIVDDNSPDACGKIAEDYASNDTRFRVVHNTENQYLAGALNTGIEASTGEFCIPLDADNLLPPRTLEVLANALSANRDIHIAYGRVQFVNEDMTPTVYRGYEQDPGHSGWPPEFRSDWQLLKRTSDGRAANLIPSTSMYRRKVWELTGGYRRRYRTAEDADFWTRAVSYGFRPAQVTKLDTLIYRNREGSMSREEEIMDWTAWLPWCRDEAMPPAAIISEKQAPIPAFDAPQISVIIPVGPAHRELVIDALDSVDAQTYRDWECIVVNDSGSPLRWAPSWARVIDTSGSLGVAAARNLGISASKGWLFVPLDADDTLEPDALRQMRIVQERFNGYVYCDFMEIWKGREPKPWAAEEYDPNLLLTRGCLHAVTGLYRKADWETVGGFDEELPAWEDWDFQLKLANIGVCGTRIPAPLFSYRKDTGFRREENYGDFEASKAGILAKWRPYFYKEKELMACGGCGGGGGGRVTTPRMTAEHRVTDIPIDGYSIVEYTGAKMGAFGMRGESGQVYRFSADEAVKYVLPDDLEMFRSRDDFRVREATKETAVAVG